MIADSTVLLLSLAVNGLQQHRIVSSCWNLGERSPTQYVLTMAFIFQLPLMRQSAIRRSVIRRLGCAGRVHSKHRERLLWNSRRLIESQRLEVTNQGKATGDSKRTQEKSAAAALPARRKSRDCTKCKVRSSVRACVARKYPVRHSRLETAFLHGFPSPQASGVLPYRFISKF